MIMCHCCQSYPNSVSVLTAQWGPVLPSRRIGATHLFEATECRLWVSVIVAVLAVAGCCDGRKLGWDRLCLQPFCVGRSYDVTVVVMIHTSLSWPWLSVTMTRRPWAIDDPRPAINGRRLSSGCSVCSTCPWCCYLYCQSWRPSNTMLSCMNGCLTWRDNLDK